MSSNSIERSNPLSHNGTDFSNEIALIRDAFNNVVPETKIYLITGAERSNKTTLLELLFNRFKDDGYLCIFFNESKNLCEQFAQKLYKEGKLENLFSKSEFPYAFNGKTFTVDGDISVYNIWTFIDRMLTYLKSKNKRVLVGIDLVKINDEIRSFVFFFQQMIRQDYDFFLLLAGLTEDISLLQSTGSTTFLLRAPRLSLTQ